MDQLSSALEVLSAMITPAVLISACGMLVLSTSNRLVHVVARVRALSDRFERLTEPEGSKRQAEKLSMIISQLELLTSRARLLQRSLTSLYSIGTAFLCYSSMLLILEARRAFASTKDEMDFLWRHDQSYTS
jgi:hypothetical protein